MTGHEPGHLTFIYKERKPRFRNESHGRGHEPYRKSLYKEAVKRWMLDRKAFAQGFGDGDADEKQGSGNRQLSVASPLARATPVCSESAIYTGSLSPSPLYRTQSTLPGYFIFSFFTCAFKGRVAESNFCGTPFLQTNQEKNGNIASKAAT